MFDLGWFELAVIGAVLLVVVGPRDLPKVLRTVGIWTGKARRMARDFQKTLDDYAKESELDGVRKAVEAPGSAARAVKNAVDPTGTLARELSETDRDVRENLKETREAAAPESGAADTAGTAAPQASVPAGEEPDGAGKTPGAGTS